MKVDADVCNFCRRVKFCTLGKKRELSSISAKLQIFYTLPRLQFSRNDSTFMLEIFDIVKEMSTPNSITNGGIVWILYIKLSRERRYTPLKQC